MAADAAAQRRLFARLRPVWDALDASGDTQAGARTAVKLTTQGIAEDLAKTQGGGEKTQKNKRGKKGQKDGIGLLEQGLSEQNVASLGPLGVNMLALRANAFLRLGDKTQARRDAFSLCERFLAADKAEQGKPGQQHPAMRVDEGILGCISAVLRDWEREDLSAELYAQCANHAIQTAAQRPNKKDVVEVARDSLACVSRSFFSSFYCC
jgi:hypothetical protein